MYSKEQLRAASVCSSQSNCASCLNYETNICNDGMESVVENLAKFLLEEVEAREKAEHKARVFERALRDMAGDIVWTRDCIDKCVSDYINGAEEALKEEGK